MSKFRLIIFSAVFFALNFTPCQVFSVSAGSQIGLSAEVASVIYLTSDSQNNLLGMSNTESDLVILEKTFDGQEIRHSGSQKISPNPLSEYTLISEI